MDVSSLASFFEASCISVGQEDGSERRCYAYAKFRPNRRVAVSDDLLRKLGFASGNLIASRQAHSDGALWNFRFVVRPYAAARFGRRFVQSGERKLAERRLCRSERSERREAHRLSASFRVRR